MTAATLNRALSLLIALLIGALGVWAFIGPFFDPSAGQLGETGARAARAQEAPVLLLILFGLCLTMIVANLETRRMDARLVAALGALAAVNAALRLVTGPLGASAMFALPILCGFALGAEFGFLLGSLSLLASAFLTAGIGPWLPFQMFAAGWCGMVAGWIPRMKPATVRLLTLAAWAGFGGFFYGFMLNLWFWPYLTAADPSQHWTPGLGLLQTLGRYLAFYLATSVWWDAGRAVGNVILVLAFGPPILRLLERFRKRFRFTVEP